MNVIRNSWIEKVLAKKAATTAPSYESYSVANDFKEQTKKPQKRYSFSLRATMNKTLRGIRK